MLTDAFRGHGTFVYLAEATLAKFHNDTTALVTALKQAGMSHAWIRLHDYKMKPEPEAPTRRLVDTLRGAGIALAGWGFDAGNDPVRDARSTARMVKDCGLTHYVADIEQDEHDSSWTVEKIPVFLRELKAALPEGAQVLVSSYPYLKEKHPELMRAAASLADGFAPQVYWQKYPSREMLERRSLPPHSTRPYTVEDEGEPAAYADLCMDWWREAVGNKPIVLTGQAHWENYPKRPVPQTIAEAKLRRFLERFSGWSRICGINWWHLGHRVNTPADGAMTRDMFDAITAAKLDQRPFASA